MKHCKQDDSVIKPGYNNIVKPLISFLSTIFLFPFLILGELQTIMANLDVLKGILTDIDAKVDALKAEVGTDAADVAAAQAAQKAAEDALTVAQADLAAANEAKDAAVAAQQAAEAQVADLTANAVDQATVDQAQAIDDKLTPAAPVEPTV